LKDYVTRHTDYETEGQSGRRQLIKSAQVCGMTQQLTKRRKLTDGNQCQQWICDFLDEYSTASLNISLNRSYKASIRWQNSAPPILGYWPTS